MSRRTRVLAAATRPRRTSANVVKVNPLVWRKALSLAHGDASRIDVVTPDEVVVRNPRE